MESAPIGTGPRDPMCPGDPGSLEHAYLYVGPTLADVGWIEDPRLVAQGAGQRIAIAQPVLRPALDVHAVIRGAACRGVIFALSQGWPGLAHLRLIRHCLDLGRRTLLHWSAEERIERVDENRLRVHRRHWLVIQTAVRTAAAASWLDTELRDLIARARSVLRNSLESVRAIAVEALRWLAKAADAPRPAVEPPCVDAEIRRLGLDPSRIRDRAQQVPMGAAAGVSGTGGPPGTGVYLRLDYWTRITSGGSYGHTCFVARELARTTGRLVAFVTHPYALLDGPGIRPVVVEPPSGSSSESDLVRSTAHYHPRLQPALAALAPDYLYERLVLGNFTGALLAQRFGIPYLVEYNGSEISIRRSFTGHGFDHERFFTDAEALAFDQSIVISVVSDVVKDELIERGVDPAKILVNPNGADPAVYRPLAPEDRERLKTELGIDRAAPVVGFSGTFGGWHGIETLAAAIPEICAAEPAVRVLLIGDGDRKPVLDEAVRRHALQDRVVSTGRVAQMEGRRLLGACDIYVSPHSGHMVDRRFFGSPTKVFEYMAMAGGIVASDLEQIGEVLSPALRAEDLRSPPPDVGSRRAVLCRPGDVAELAGAVVYLARHPELARRLGENARRALCDQYSWERHVDRLWTFVREQGRDPGTGRPAAGGPHPPVAADLEVRPPAQGLGGRALAARPGSRLSFNRADA
jgi:glycosyltransferase involved in cell wall biosynthesis